MNSIKIIMSASLLLAGLSACTETTVDPGPEPAAESMTFKQNARYQYTSYRTDPSTQQKTDSTERTKVLTLVNANASVYGRSNVAAYVDSVYSTGGGFISVTDTTYLQQSSGSNNVYRYASLAPELDFTGIAGLTLDIGKEWRQEAKLGASTALWLVGALSDTFQVPGVPAVVKGVKVTVSDSAVGSAVENVTVDGKSYKSTKTTHNLTLSFGVIVDLGSFGTTTVNVPGVYTIKRTSWMAGELGAIIKEEREGTVLHLSAVAIPGTGSVALPDIPVPGSVSIMTKVLATGG